MPERTSSAILLCMILASTQISLVFGHTVLGNMTGALPYFRKNDHERNPGNTFVSSLVPGPVAYVWPGSGSNTYLDDPRLPPGYQSPFQDFEKPLQVAGSHYSPEGAILASTSTADSVGDLVFGLNFSKPQEFETQNPSLVFRYKSITIYIPAPVKNKAGMLEQDGFEPVGINWKLGETTNIVTTLTDSYGNISVTQAGPRDPFGPNWWMIRIVASGNGIEFTPQRNWAEWYYVRVNQLRGPMIAGRYFFKIFLDDHYPIKEQGLSGQPNLVNSTMPMENWPVLLVKAGLDPAIIYGTIRHGGTMNSALYGLPLQLAGHVRAVGVAIDPNTGKLLAKPVEARSYFNASSKGHYEVEGVAPGVYEIYASAAGFPEQKVAQDIRVLKGQSLALDLYLKPGAEVRGQIFAKSLLSPSNWIQELPMRIVIYDSDDYLENSVVSYSPLNLTHSPYTSYVQGNTVFDIFHVNPPPYVKGGLRTPSRPKLVAFPWEGPVSYYPYTSNPNTKDPYGIFNGVGPAQVWWVSPSSVVDPQTALGSTSNSFIFQFGARGVYGAPAKLSGMIPQIFATWIDGLSVGTYFVRAHVHGYVQTTSDGLTFTDYRFKISSIERDTAVHVQIDLYQSGTIDVTVHFLESPGTSQASAIGGPDLGRYLIAEAADHYGRTAALNFTMVSSSTTSATITLSGLGMAGLIFPPDPRSGVKYSLEQYQGLRDYGIMPGAYTVRVYLRGYIQASSPAFRLLDLDAAPICVVTLASHSFVSVHMYRGGGINATVRSVDWQMPRNARNWAWNNTEAYLLIYDVASRSFVDVAYFWNSTAQSWTLPRTNSQFNSIPWPGWKTKFGLGASYLYTNGSVMLERFGPALPNPTSLTPLQDMATNLFLENIFRLGFLFSTRNYRTSDYKSSIAIYPGRYALTVWTYGYVQEGVYDLGDLGKVSVAVPAIGSQGDSNVQVMKGVTFNLTIAFRTEGMLKGIPCNSSMRIRVYDESDRLVAAASTSYDPGVTIPSAGFFADQKKIVSSGGAVSIPWGTRLVEYRNLAGMYRYTELLTGAEIVRRAMLFSPDYGIWGSVGMGRGYRGNWTVKIDMVNWYPPTQFHPASPALLQGESPFLYPYNHLGPYEARMNQILPNHLLGGELSAVLALDMRAYIRGHVYQLNWFDETRTASWATIEMKKGKQSFRTYSLDGFYESYLPSGEYEFVVSLRIPSTERLLVAIKSEFLSDGAMILGEDFFLEGGSPTTGNTFGLLVTVTLTLNPTLPAYLLTRRLRY